MKPYPGSKRQRILSHRAKRDRRRYERRKGYSGKFFTGHRPLSNARENPPSMEELAKAAHEVVCFLLENDLIKACAACEKEFGVHNPEASHTFCKRHLIDAYKQMIRANPNNVEGNQTAQQKIAEIEARPDNTFAPDLAKTITRT